MTKAQLRDAHQQMLSFCRGSEALYKADVGEYEMLSARDVLYALGFMPNEADDVLAAIGKAGFDYCLDPTVPHEGRIPTRDVCVWGIDQLRSRLDSVTI